MPSSSPGIAAGNNTADLAFDQRLAPYHRDNGFADIGAYETQNEIIFSAAFDGCTTLP